jgi:hypothetical protein
MPHPSGATPKTGKNEITDSNGSRLRPLGSAEDPLAFCERHISEKQMKPFLLLFLSVLVLLAPAVFATDTIIQRRLPDTPARKLRLRAWLPAFMRRQSVAFKLDEAYPHQVFTGFIQNPNAISNETR